MNSQEQQQVQLQELALGKLQRDVRRLRSAIRRVAELVLHSQSTVPMGLDELNGLRDAVDDIAKRGC